MININRAIGIICLGAAFIEVKYSVLAAALGDTTAATIWLILGVLNLITGAANLSTIPKRLKRC